MKREILGWTVASILVACGGSNQAAHDEGGHREGRHAEGGDHPELPPAVNAFHDVLAPIWHAEPGDTRRALACDRDNLHDLESAADDVEAMSLPVGVDEAEWYAAADGLAASVDGVAGACEGGGEAAEERLAEVHQAFHVVANLVGHERDAVPDTDAEAANVAAHEAEHDEGGEHDEGAVAESEPAE